MPYVTQERRAELDPYFSGVEESPQNGGDLNYLISKLCAEFIFEHGLNYANISDVVGALEGAKQEFYRQVVNPYEDVKILENGGLPAYHWANNRIEGLKEIAINKALDAVS